MAPARRAAAAVEARSSPWTPAQTMAAVAASPAPVVLTTGRFSQGRRIRLSPWAARMPTGPRLTFTCCTPARSSAYAARSGSRSPVWAAASRALGLMARSLGRMLFSRRAFTVDTGSAIMGAVQLAAR